MVLMLTQNIYAVKEIQFETNSKSVQQFDEIDVIILQL